MATRKPDKINRWIGRNIRRYRTGRRLSEHALAARAGIQLKQLRRYESGESCIPAGRLLQVSRTLGVPVEELFRNGGGLPEMWDEEFAVFPAHQAHRAAFAVARMNDPQLRRLFVTLAELVINKEEER